MKKKFSKIFGVGLTVVMLASLIVFAAPVSAATDEFAAVNAPNSSSSLGGFVVAPGSDVIDIEVTNDGAIFAATPVGPQLETWGGTAEWTTEEVYAGHYSFKLTPPVAAKVPCGMTLQDLVDLGYATVGGTPDLPVFQVKFSYWFDTGVRPHAKFYLDTTGNGAVDAVLTSGFGVADPGLDTQSKWIEAWVRHNTGWDLADYPGFGNLRQGDLDTLATLENWTLADVTIVYVAYGCDNEVYVDDITIGGVSYVMEPQSQLYKSVDGGKSWVATSFTSSETIVDIAASPTYSTDATLWVATGRNTYRTTTGGLTFSGAMGWGALSALETDETITSIDVANDYEVTGLNVVVGTAVTGAARVLLYRNMAWTALGATGANGFTTTPDAAFVSFSPNYDSDGEVIAITADGTNTYILTSFCEEDWGALVSTATITTVVATDASIAFPDYYDATAPYAFIGLIDATIAYDPTKATTIPAGDVFLYVGRTVPGTSVCVDCNVGGSLYPGVGITSVAASGSMAAPIVFAGAAAMPVVAKTTNITATVPTWAFSTKSPGITGSTINVTVKLANDFATSDVVYAATKAGDSAFSVSDDGGSIFNGVSLIDTVINALSDVAAASEDVLFLITNTAADATTDGARESLWKTVNGGTTWERVFADEDMAEVKVSPSFADDGTLYVAESTGTRMWRSVNGGDTFTAVTAKDPVVAWTVVDGTTLLTGASDNNIWKSVNSGMRWTYATTKPAYVANEIVISPDYDEDSTVLVGTNDGVVYMSINGGVGFSKVGVSGPCAGNLFVAFDPAYATNSTIYAGGVGAGIGIFRWVVGTSTEWDEINDSTVDSTAITLEVYGLKLSSAGVMYAADHADVVAATPVGGMQRSVSPTASLAKVEGYNQGVLKGLTDGMQVKDIELVESPTVLFVLADGSQCKPVLADSLMSYVDTLSTAPSGLSVVPETTAKVNISWEALSGALTYNVYLALDPALTSGLLAPLGTTGTEGTSIVVSSLTPGTLYYWVVRAQTPVYSPYGGGSFTMGLEIPTLRAPFAYATDVIIRPNFAWDAVTGALSYEFELADNAAYSGATKKTLSSTVWACDADLSYSSTYYWKVRAISDTTQGVWLEGIFTTEKKPVAPPEPVAPAEIPPSPLGPYLPMIPMFAWIIIGVGAALVIAVIVLIVRTRRVS